MRKAPLGLLGWLVIVTIWVTWSPFEWKRGGPDFQLETTFDWEAAGHLLLLVPLAVVLAVLVHRSDSRRPVGYVWGTVVLFGMFLELGQLWIEGRGLSLYDALANCIGVTGAVWGTAQLMRRGLGTCPILVSVGILVFTSVQIGTLYRVLVISQGCRLTGWEPDFVVLAGEERGGHKKYQGRVWNARLCAGEPSSKVCIAPGANEEDRHRLTQAAEASHRIEVSAQVWSYTDKQTGYPRIVTFSQDELHRNTTLVQSGRDLYFRVRTPWSGLDGHQAVFILADAVPTGVPTSVVASFDRCVIRMQAKSAARTVSASFRPDLLRVSALRKHNRGVPGIWGGWGGLVIVLGLFVAVGMAVGWLLRPRWRVGVLASPVIAVVSLWMVDTFVLGIPPPGAYEAILVMGATMLGAMLAWWDWSRMRMDRKGAASR
jgi:VanZ family protein